MPIDLAALLAPARTAVLVMECQEGVVGEHGLGALADAVRRHGTIARIAVLLDAARAAGARIFHCTMSRRPDGGGATANCRLLAATAKRGMGLVPGTPAHAIVPALAPAEGDWVVTRWHGLTPFHATELDQLLRNLGVGTVVATGVSVNVGITGLVLEAVNRGYQVVLPTDAVAGTPDAYVASVMEHTLALLATLTTTDAVVRVWGG
jgi:nicotinamidase-related amidase